jgi:hypothetical protein
MFFTPNAGSDALQGLFSRAFSCSLISYPIDISENNPPPFSGLFAQAGRF